MAGFLNISLSISQYSSWQNYNPEFVLNDAILWSSTRLYSMKSDDFYPLVPTASSQFQLQSVLLEDYTCLTYIPVGKAKN